MNQTVKENRLIVNVEKESERRKVKMGALEENKL